MRVWRNWQTRKIQVLVFARGCRFKSCYPHMKISCGGVLPQGIFFFCVNLVMILDRPLGLIRASLDFYDVYVYGYAVLFAVVDDKSSSA